MNTIQKNSKSTLNRKVPLVGKVTAGYPISMPPTAWYSLLISTVPLWSQHRVAEPWPQEFETAAPRSEGKALMRERDPIEAEWEEDGRLTRRVSASPVSPRHSAPLRSERGKRSGRVSMPIPAEIIT